MRALLRVRTYFLLSVSILASTCYPALSQAANQAVNSSASTSSASDEDRKVVAGLDAEYQAAVKKNDAATMDRILADNFVLVTGSGKTYTKADLLREAQSGKSKYEQNVERVQTVRVWSDTAVVTAKLWEKGTEDEKPFDHLFWFSDTYVRTPTGWRYVFGQSAYCLYQKMP